MAKYEVIAATGCPTGIAHTYMAQEALEEAAKKRGISIKVETHGQSGVEHAFSQSEIDQAKGVIVAADKDVDIDRFDGKRLINVSVTKGMKEPDELIEKILNDKNVPVYHSAGGSKASSSEETELTGSFWHKLYVYLMNGVSHMLPLVVAGGVLTAVSFFWGINSADPKSAQYNAIAALLNTIGGFAMNLMVPVLCAYIAEAIGKRTGLIIGFVTGMIAYTNGTGFLGGIVGGFLAGYVAVLLTKLFKSIPKSLDGLKSIFIFPVLGVLISGTIMWYGSVPMKDLNTGMMAFLKSMENSSPILLGLIVGIMCAADMGGPINKAAYLTGTALLAQGNYFFMAGVSAACIAPPLATGFAVLFNKKAYTAKERSAGYVNFLLGSTHITEGAIPFAAKNPLLNIPSFMVGSAIAAILSYVTKISVPAPHGGFIVLPLVNKPFLWVLWIVIGALVSGFLLSIIAGRQSQKNTVVATSAGNVEVGSEDKQVPKEESNNDLGEILNKNNIALNVDVSSRDELLQYLSDFSEKLGYSTDSKAVYKKYLAREDENSTGMEKGIAIPHAQDKSIKGSAMLIAKLTKPVEWKTFDNQPVDIVISFLIPDEDNGSSHLEYLSSTSKLLMHDEFIESLRKAQTKEEILKLFK
ncbi:fructose-specific PTS transporter subunit EIIC [Companilactobacillus pabuli]|jgi:fructose-specific phosphotransferase system IIC component/fructose-specific phosphotransferase system IIA component/fructose-specific phosphotransferase system IIB component|uniref:PTS transporter subunit EIIA n=1 Tax=Companilactobacillus pabuli TaxID=2714036 RepID=A0A7L7KX49_9LACO|nr:fructose-specific PTS transporter subunit EIIC [Companilactobacillus pabuli]AKP04012.1 PTS fructose transporter subunit IIABC [Companilactobacillus farciminis]AKS52317.1 PTS fructose transporter subunit IIABC [Companilactobacillus farciminis]MDG5113274.1 fructose-specific PTS transporter subunit EIIC [Companilactobacillus pabuli]QMT83922.1 PTS transporter subunit EIIA [Companilactobacillus pabuli]